MKIIPLFLSAFLLLTCMDAKPESDSFPIGHYGKFNYNASSGDLLGIEVLIIRGRSGYFVVFQAAEGERDDPILIPAKISGKTIEFEIPDGGTGYSGVLRATLKGDVLKAHFSNGQLSPSGQKFFDLKRK